MGRDGGGLWSWASSASSKETGGSEVLDVLKHLTPGFPIDLLMPIVKRLPQNAWVYCGLGFLAAMARTTTEFAVVLLLGARAEVYLFAASRTVPNLIAGTPERVRHRLRTQGVPNKETIVVSEAASGPADPEGGTCLKIRGAIGAVVPKNHPPKARPVGHSPGRVWRRQ